jgi:muramidase (phage lysozyme)
MWIDVKFNERSNQFEVHPTEEGIRVANQNNGRMSMGMTVLQVLERLNNSNVTQAVDKINAGIRNISPILEANKFSTTEEIKKLTSFISLTDKKNPTFWQWLLSGSKLGDVERDKTFGGSNLNFTPASGGNESTRGKPLSLENTPLEAVKSAFSKDESGDNYNRLVHGSGTPKEAPLTDMPIRDVLAYQSHMIANGHASTAAGKYQILKKTLRSLVNEGVVSLDDKFSPDTQEKLADALMERRGMNDFLEGKISHSAFLRNLGDEWEAIKKFSRTAEKVLKALEEAQKEKIHDDQVARLGF